MHVPLSLEPFPELNPPQQQKAMQRRYLALWFPFLSTDLISQDFRSRNSGRPDNAPLVLVDKVKGALRLAALDQEAARSGLTIGMTLADARAWLPGLRVDKADTHADERFRLRIAAFCEMFTPLVALDARDGLILDITGCVHLFGGEAALHRLVRQRLGSRGLSIRAAIADTPEAARTLARFGPGTIAKGEEAIYPLPITALDIDRETILALSRAGLKTLGDLTQRPPKILAARFGASLIDRLNRVLGREDIRLVPLRMPPDCMAERHFPEPLATIDALLATLERLAREISQHLEERGRGGRLFEASFFRADGAVRRLTIETGTASRDASSLMRLLRLKIETLADPLDPGFGFDALRLAVLRSEPIDVDQKDLEQNTSDYDEEREVAALLDHLVTRFGRNRVLRFVSRDSHDPIGSGDIAPISQAEEGAGPVVEEGQPPTRPLSLFEPPQPIEAMAEVPDGPPLRFRWRKVMHEVALAEGPERIAPEWWQQGGPLRETRDYYRIEDMSGHRFWIFRQGFYADAETMPRWFLHGLFA